MKKRLKIVFGAFVMGVGQGVFLIPNKIAAGGVSGIAAIIENTVGLKSSVSVMIINFPLFILAYKLLGKKFLKGSFLGTLAFSLSLELVSEFNFSGNLVAVCVAGSVLSGFGMAFVLMNDATTGGTDIAARILKIYFPHLSVGKLIMAVDGAVVIASAIAFKNFELAVFALISLYITTVIIDRIIEGADFAKAIYVISNKSEEISHNILTKMQRGVTGIKGTGMYSKKDTTVLLCIVRNYELATLKKHIYEIDTEAFLIISDVREVMGEGFRLL